MSVKDKEEIVAKAINEVMAFLNLKDLETLFTCAISLKNLYK